MKLTTWQQYAFALLAATAIVLLCGSAFLAVGFSDNASAAARTTTPSSTPIRVRGASAGIVATPSATRTVVVIALPTVTPILTPKAPTATPRPTPAPIPPLAGYHVLAQFAGSLYGDSKTLTLPAGTIHLVVTYADDGEPVHVAESDQYAHDQALRNIDSNYQPTLSILQAQLNMALATHDTAKVDDAQKQLDTVSQKKANDIAAENARFDALVATLEAKRPPSNIRVYLGQSDGDPDMILTFLGSGTRVLDFPATGAADYFFHVESTGGWTLNVYSKQ